MKTKIRRLYDIANIMLSLGIIVKTTLIGPSKKPAFRWVGLHPGAPGPGPAHSGGDTPQPSGDTDISGR